MMKITLFDHFELLTALQVPKLNGPRLIFLLLHLSLEEVDGDDRQNEIHHHKGT